MSFPEFLGDLRITIRDRYWEERYGRRGVPRPGPSTPLFVGEFPKSGGTWMTNMVREAVDVGVERGDEWRPVIHHHWRASPRIRPAVYVLRDPRDVVVSFYFHHLRQVKVGTLRAGRVHRYLQERVHRDYLQCPVAQALPGFISSLQERPFGGILRKHRDARFDPWQTHVRSWRAQAGVLVVRYEDLLEAPADSLGLACKHLGVGIPPDRIPDIVERNSFERLTGRAPGTASDTAFLRKGVAGDWKNYFTRATADAFRSFAGGLLVDLGYEEDDTWVEALPS